MSKIELLDLRAEKEDDENEVVVFDEFMDTGGNWMEANSNSNQFNVVKELDYKSSPFRYFLCQLNISRDVCLYRVRK